MVTLYIINLYELRKEEKTHGENPPSKKDMKYTKNKLLQTQVGVNLIRCMEESSSWEQVVVAPISGSSA